VTKKKRVLIQKKERNSDHTREKYSACSPKKKTVEKKMSRQKQAHYILPKKNNVL